MSADGSIIINTKIDTSGFTKSASEMKTQFGGLASAAKKLGTAIAAAFSIRAIVQFGRESVNAASEMSNALRGLQSILEGQGRSFSVAQQFIKEYTQDGLIPAANAITAYKNLASRGYDDSQIRQVMIALKDASAFGRQASYSMGEAVQSATEGLRNENSTLVDNAGVTKNVAKMWDEYAASIGTTANNLTQQQKIQAEVNGILAESRFQAGDAAIVAGTFSGQLLRIAAAFKEIKTAVGQGLISALTPVLGVINAILGGVQKVASAFAQLSAMLFGSSGDVSVGATEQDMAAIASGYEAAAGGAEDLAKGTEKAGKAAKKYLANFDEIQKIGDNAADAGDAVSGGVGAVGGGDFAIDVPVGISPVVKDEISPQIKELAERIKAKVQELIAPVLEIDTLPLKASLANLGETFSAFGGIVVDALEWAWFNILVPLAEWTIESAGPAAIDLFSAALSVLNEIIIALQPLGVWLWDTFLQPIAEWTGGIIVSVLEGITAALTGVSDWIAEHQGAVEAITIVILSFMAAWQIVNLAQLIGGIVSALGAFIVSGGLATAITTGLATAVAFLTSPITLTVAAIGALIAIIVLLVKNWDTVKETAANVWAAIKEIWSGISIWFEKQVLEPLAAGFKGMVNGVIGFLNGLISGIVRGVNTAIKAVNKLSFNVPDWIPGIGGETFGFSIPTMIAPQIPYLAKGAVIPPRSPFMAVLGDQKNGVNVEAPLSTIQEAVANVMADILPTMLAGFEAVVAEQRQTREVIENIEVGDDVIGQAVARYNRKMAIARGG